MPIGTVGALGPLKPQEFFTPPLVNPPFVPPVASQDDDLHCTVMVSQAVLWPMVGDDLTEYSFPPPPPVAMQDDDVQVWTMRTLLVVDDGQEPSLPPIPPIAKQDDDPCRWTVATQTVLDAGQESFLPPQPPLAPIMAWDDLGVMWRQQSWASVAGIEEVEYGIVVIPAPPAGGLVPTNVILGGGDDDVVSGGSINLGGIG